MTPGRVLALDVGDRRIGVAVSDEGRVIAQPHSVYERVGYGPDTRHIAGLYGALSCSVCVLGEPRNMDGSLGFQAEKVRAFGDLLARAGLNVQYCDERLTTISAERSLREDGMHGEQRRRVVDKIAAAVILRQYLEQTGRTEP